MFVEPYEPPVPSEAPAFYEWDGETWYFNKRMGYHLNRAGSLLHRCIWTKLHGPIPDEHEVNHINRKRWDNRLENLELLQQSDHRRLSVEQRDDSAWFENMAPDVASERLRNYWQRREPRAVNCSECGKEFFSTGMRAKFCSAACRNADGRRKNQDARNRRKQGA